MADESNAPQHPPEVLRNYALVADGERGALIGPDGDVAWMCAPRWDSDAVFSGLLGGAGAFSVCPVDRGFVASGWYLEGSLVWRSRWQMDVGVIECDSTLAFPGSGERVVFLRRIRAIGAPARVRITLDVRAGFGRHAMTGLSTRDGVRTGRSGQVHFRYTGAPTARRRPEGGLVQVLELEAGQEHDLVLELSEGELDGPVPDTDTTWAGSLHAWRQEVPSMDHTVAPRDARQSYAVLRGMTSASGAMVAAATTSLPEHVNQKRNYDYRYAWVRDQCFAGQAVAACGPYPLLDSALHFISERILEDGEELRPAYTVAGGDVPDEQDLDLPGYPGAPARIGNHANRQHQLDAFGEALLLYAAGARHQRLQPAHWEAVEVCIRVVEKRWRLPEAGIWELEDREWTHSKLICVAGLRTLASHVPGPEAARWIALAEEIMAEVSATSIHPSGRWQRNPEDPRVDASLLRPALRGAVPPEDPRTVATLQAVREELAEQGYLYRFRHDERELSRSEGAFLLCGFDMALALAQQGDRTEAMRWFERNRCACGSPGLFTEEYGVQERQLRGNLPQAFVHAAMLEAAATLAVDGDSQDNAPGSRTLSGPRDRLDETG
ncbi:MAG TPA: glycoside hydrolase family 15 protein [Arthrobacter sp.]|nr:glycoside hydrolase family 15 protein [Arthrobacter sp.]